MQLTKQKPQRLFTLGCSFTQYQWPTWADIVALDLGLPLHNLATSGAGNQYIVNMFAQANQHYEFNSDDLIMICWTGFFREDRWISGNWYPAGDITCNNFYDQQFVDKYADPVGCYVRDLAGMSLVKSVLDHIGCQYHFQSMNDIWTQEDRQRQLDDQDTALHKLSSLYENLIQCMLPSYENVIWHHDLVNYKTRQQQELFEGREFDPHPLPSEHLNYLLSVYNQHEFAPETLQQVNNINHDLIATVRQLMHQHPDLHGLNDLPDAEFTQLCERFILPVYQMHSTSLLH